jgi:hypothetical protein
MFPREISSKLRNVIISADSTSFKAHVTSHEKVINFRFLLSTHWPPPTPSEWKFEEEASDGGIYGEDDEGRLFPHSHEALRAIHQKEMAYLRTNIQEAEEEGEYVVVLTYYPPSFLMYQEGGDAELLWNNVVFWGFGSKSTYVNTMKMSKPFEEPEKERAHCVRISCQPFHSLDVSCLNSK